ncbi:MAG: GNAT family N-acetyltransferase [Ruminiclostridium sp.]|nr:GNAT family N-acetyltransferase [Ruminiclostridium sp.]
MSLENRCNFSLRRARESDLPAVMLLYRSAIGFPGLPWSEEYPNHETLAADYAAGGLYILEENGLPVAAASVVPENEHDDMTCWQILDGTQKELARVVVDQSERKRGYAKKMLTLLLEELEKSGCHTVHLLVAVGNEAANRLYRSLSFEFLCECREYDCDFYACEKILSGDTAT